MIPERVAEIEAIEADFGDHAPHCLEAPAAGPCICGVVDARRAIPELIAALREAQEKITGLRALIRDLRDALQVAERQYTGVNDDDAQWRELIARCDEALK